MDHEYRRVTVRGLTLDPVTNAPIVILKTEEGGRFLPIWIGLFEANAIAMQMEGISTPRPMTHDLLRNLVDTLGATVTRVVVHSLRENTFHATLFLGAAGEERPLDARPSDAIAVALRAGAPIFVSDEVLASARVVEVDEGRGSASPRSGAAGSSASGRRTSQAGRGGTVKADDELRALLDRLGRSMREAIRGSEDLQEALRELEARGYTPSLTLGIALGRSERGEEIQETLLGPGPQERPVSIRRLSAFDRKFLRALRIQNPSA